MTNFDIPDIHAILDALEEKLVEKLNLNPFIVGIHSGGAWLADILHRRAGLEEPIGTLDISFYRDDFTKIGINPEVKASQLPVDIDDRNIILIDDVLHTGRTTRAAMNALFDYGRPRSILLMVAIERDGRELPVQADMVGQSVHLTPNQHIKLIGPENLRFSISTKNQ